MPQKFHITHLSSFTPLVQRLLEHTANFTEDNSCFDPLAIKEIVDGWEPSFYCYKLRQIENRFALFENYELVLSMELIEVYKLT